jgi:hypothetical protein
LKFGAIEKEGIQSFRLQNIENSWETKNNFKNVA